MFQASDVMDAVRYRWAVRTRKTGLSHLSQVEAPVYKSALGTSKAKSRLESCYIHRTHMITQQCELDTRKGEQLILPRSKLLRVSTHRCISFSSRILGFVYSQLMKMLAPIERVCQTIKWVVVQYRFLPVLHLLGYVLDSL